jgi:hypothetical protein
MTAACLLQSEKEWLKTVKEPFNILQLLVVSCQWSAVLGSLCFVLCMLNLSVKNQAQRTKYKAPSTTDP